MTVLNIIGGYNRESVQALINPLLDRGGVKEVQLLKLGDESLIEEIASECILVNEYENIYAVDVEGLLKKDNSFPDVMIISVIHMRCQNFFLGYRIHQLKS